MARSKGTCRRCDLRRQVNIMINMVYLYIIHESFLKASSFKDTISWRAPMTYTIENVDEGYVRVAMDVGGNPKPIGASITDRPTTYMLRGDNFPLQLSDTRGLADTRGTEFDRHACDHIMHQVSTIGILHAIIVLLKPDVTTLTAQFCYCLVELLRNTHRSVTMFSLAFREPDRVHSVQTMKLGSF